MSSKRRLRTRAAVTFRTIGIATVAATAALGSTALVADAATATTHHRHHGSPPTPKPPTPKPPTPTPPPTANTQPTGISGNWTLAFDDEFNGTSLDTSKWSATPQAGNINGTTTSASNVTVSGGYAILTLASSNSGAVISTAPWDGGRGASVPVGGVAEARIDFPGNGTSIYNWPAWWVWGQSWPAGGENDIAEAASAGNGVLGSNYHSPSCDCSEAHPSGTWSNSFHTYAVYRHATSSDVYWDGAKVASYPTSDNGSPEYLRIDNTKGTGGGGHYGTASGVKVDYVRVWDQG